MNDRRNAIVISSQQIPSYFSLDDFVKVANRDLGDWLGNTGISFMANTKR